MIYPQGPVNASRNISPDSSFFIGGTKILDIIYGAILKPQTQQLVDAMAALDLDGSLYVGYPLLKLGEENVTADALLTARECGVVVFDLPPVRRADETPGEWLAFVQSRQDDLYRSLFNKLFTYRELTAGRNLAFTIGTVSFIPDVTGLPLNESAPISDVNTLRKILELFPGISEETLIKLNAAVQRTRSIKPRSRRDNVKRLGSRGERLRRIEAEIANLDAWQKQGAIEFPEGPQRIRGLAGSGKTIVLALKAAYLHAAHPDWNIGVTFQTRSLYQQFTDQIRRFCYETIEDEPNWERLRVLHAWGSRSEPGVYSEIALSVGFEFRNFVSARSAFGANAFEGSCAELLDYVKRMPGGPPARFDAILIDEAQDFPAPFFQLVYSVCSPQKRIIWAYDELQNLGQYAMAPPAELFGVDDKKRPFVELKNEVGRARQDIVLPRCYRNTPWALAIAHALGFGIYKRDGLVQMFDDAELWLDVGYQVKSGTLALGQKVALARRPDSAPGYFQELLSADEALTWQVFATEDEQAAWVAADIAKAITDEELEARDVLLVLPNTITAKSIAPIYMKALDKVGIASHLAGVTSSRDVLFIENSIAITQIYRAKGNEAALVYVVNAQYCYSGYELQRRRNTLFTAITRSRAWVRVCGVGDDMRLLIEEIEKVKGSDYVLDFQYPTPGEILQMKRIHRDLEPAERARLQDEIAAATSLFGQLDAGDIALDAIPVELREIMKRLAQRSSGD